MCMTSTQIQSEFALNDKGYGNYISEENQSDKFLSATKTSIYAQGTIIQSEEHLRQCLGDLHDLPCALSTRGLPSQALSHRGNAVKQHPEKWNI